jgi:hypothetical protein
MLDNRSIVLLDFLFHAIFISFQPVRLFSILSSATLLFLVLLRRRPSPPLIIILPRHRDGSFSLHFVLKRSHTKKYFIMKAAGAWWIGWALQDWRYTATPCAVRPM